jgi:hypothetical protein
MLDPSMELAPHASSKPPDSGLSALPTTQVAARIPAVSIVRFLSMYLHGINQEFKIKLKTMQKPDRKSYA